MHFVIPFWLFLGGSLAFIFAKGSTEGRILTVAVTLATLSTLMFHEILGIEAAQPFILAIDAALLVVVARMSLKSRVFWPMWFCSFHAITVATNVARFLFGAELPTLYTNLAGFWALPALGAAVVGILLDHRAGLERELD